MDSLPVIINAIFSGARIHFLFKVKEDVFYDNMILVDNGGLRQNVRFFLFVNMCAKFLIEKKIDYLVINRLSNNNLLYKAIVEAARTSDDVKSIELEHGHSGCYHPNLIASWIINYDYFYCQDDSMQNYIREEAKKRNVNIQVGGWGKQKKVRGKNNKKLIIYAPTMMGLDRYEQLMPETLRYQFKKEIVRVLSDIKKQFNYDIIYKLDIKGDTQFDPIPDYILDNNLSIRIEGGDLDGLLGKASAYITDTAISTPMFSAVEMAVPPLCLKYDKSVGVRKDIYKLWNPAIKFFHDVSEIEKILADFFYELDHREGFIMPIIKNTITKFPWGK